MPAPEMVLCINQSWGCRLNKTYEVLDHWFCDCGGRNVRKGLIHIAGEVSISAKNPKGVECIECGRPTPEFTRGWFPGAFFVPITGKPSDSVTEKEVRELFGPSPINEVEEKQLEELKT